MYGYSVQIYTQMVWRTKPFIDFLYEGKGDGSLSQGYVFRDTSQGLAF